MTVPVPVRVTLASVIICAVVGPVIGTAVWGALIGQPLLVLSADIIGIPVVAYAAISVGPVGVVMGLLAGLMTSSLLSERQTPRAFLEWTGLGVVAGVGVGCLAPLYVLVERPSGELAPVAFAAAAFITAGVCGALIGMFAWYSERSRRRGAQQIKHGDA